jgi:hypothetical protein
MNALRLLLLTIGITGGALWVGLKESGARASAGCGGCIGQTCTAGKSGWTCRGGCDGNYCYCASSEGCARH